MATYFIKDTAPVIYAFAKRNIKQPLLAILPYVLICGMITAIVDKSHPFIAVLAQVGTFYFSCIYASNIHRAFLHGAPAFRFDPFKPKREDWRFMGMVFVLALILIIVPVTGILIAAIMPFMAIKTIVVLASIFVTIWFAWRLSLVLPDRAIGGRMKLRESFRLTDGMVIKMFLTPIAASWLVLLACIGWILVAAILGTVLIHFAYPQANAATDPLVKLFFYILMAPGSVGLAYFCSTVSVASLSNYYLWAKENHTPI